MDRTVTVAVQVLPLCEDPYPVVDRAIAVIQRSGVKYEVGAMETTMEGELPRLLAVAQEAHAACFVEGVDQVVTIIKIGDARGGSTIADKVQKYR
ncbi:MAG: thiamine-binding protein [Anaerolineae bacterium]